MRMPKRKDLKKHKTTGQRTLRVYFQPCKCFSVGKKSKFKFGR